MDRFERITCIALPSITSAGTLAAHFSDARYLSLASRKNMTLQGMAGSRREKKCDFFPCSAQYSSPLSKIIGTGDNFYFKKNCMYKYKESRVAQSGRGNTVASQTGNPGSIPD